MAFTRRIRAQDRTSNTQTRAPRAKKAPACLITMSRSVGATTIKRGVRSIIGNGIWPITLDTKALDVRRALTRTPIEQREAREA